MLHRRRSGDYMQLAEVYRGSHTNPAPKLPNEIYGDLVYWSDQTSKRSQQVNIGQHRSRSLQIFMHTAFLLSHRKSASSARTKSVSTALAT